MGLVSKGKQADARWFGIGVHIALAEWYRKGTRRGPHPADTFEQWIGDEIAFVKTWLGSDFDEHKWEDARELGINMLEGYFDKWGRDPQWHIIAVEQPFSVRIKHAGKPVAIFRSRWDGVARDLDSGLIILLEHKTASQVNLAYLEGDDQAGVYCAVASEVLRAKGVLKPGEEIAGIQYNILRKAMADERETDADGYSLNKDGTISKRQPTARFIRPDLVERSPAQNATQLKRIEDEVAVMNAVRLGIIPVTKTRTKDCPHSCDFWNMCLLHDFGDDRWLELKKAHFTAQDPYEDTRKSASG